MEIEDTMNTKEAAEYIGRSKSWLNASRCVSTDLFGEGPSYKKNASGRVFYEKKDLDLWLESREKKTRRVEFINGR